MSDGATLVYWPWWLGGAALAIVCIIHVAVSGRLLTVSGMLARIGRWREDERDRAREIELSSGGLDEKLLAATRAQFGDMELPPELTGGVPASTSCGASPRIRLPVSAGATFIVALMLGGTLAAFLHGPPTGAGTWSLGTRFEELMGTGAFGVMAALAGGFLVGFGGRMAGGCTSGHGLSGLGRLQPGSFLATAAFFAGGAAVSFLIKSSL